MLIFLSGFWKLFLCIIGDRIKREASGKGRRILKEIGNGMGWQDPSGRIWTAEQIEHKFDALTKISIRHRAKDAVDKYARQIKKFPVQPAEVLELALPIQPEFICEKVKAQLIDASLFFDDERVAEAIEKLPPGDKQIIEWRYVCGYSEKAIAEWLKIQKDSVEKRRYRAIRRLKEILGVLPHGE